MLTTTHIPLRDEIAYMAVYLYHFLLDSWVAPYAHFSVFTVFLFFIAHRTNLTNATIVSSSLLVVAATSIWNSLPGLGRFEWPNLLGDWNEIRRVAIETVLTLLFLYLIRNRTVGRVSAPPTPVELERLRSGNHVLRNTVRELREVIDAMNGEVARLRKQLSELQKRILAFSNKVKDRTCAQRAEIRRLTNELFHLRRAVQQRENYINTLRAEVTVLRRREDQFKKDLYNRETEIAEHKSQQVPKDNNIASLTRQLNQRDATIQQLQRRVRDLELQDIYIIEAKNNLAAKNKVMSDLENKLKTRDAEFLKLSEQFADKEATETQLAEKTKLAEALDVQITIMNARFARQTPQLNKREAEVKSLKAQLDAANSAPMNTQDTATQTPSKGPPSQQPSTTEGVGRAPKSARQYTKTPGSEQGGKKKPALGMDKKQPPPRTPGKDEDKKDDDDNKPDPSGSGIMASDTLPSVAVTPTGPRTPRIVRGWSGVAQSSRPTVASRRGRDPKNLATINQAPSVAPPDNIEEKSSSAQSSSQPADACTGPPQVAAPVEPSTTPSPDPDLPPTREFASALRAARTTKQENERKRNQKKSKKAAFKEAAQHQNKDDASPRRQTASGEKKILDPEKQKKENKRKKDSFMAKQKKKAEDTQATDTPDAPPTQQQQGIADQRDPVEAPTQVPNDAILVDLTSPDIAPEPQPSVGASTETRNEPALQPPAGASTGPETEPQPSPGTTVEPRTQPQEVEVLVTKPSESPNPPKTAGWAPASNHSPLTPHHADGSSMQAESDVQRNGFLTAPGREQCKPTEDDALASFDRMSEVIRDMDLSLARLDSESYGASLGGPAMQAEDVYTPGPTATELMQLDEQEPIAQPMDEDIVLEGGVNMDQPKEAEDADMQDSQSFTQSDAFLEAARQLSSNLRREEQQANHSLAASNPSQAQEQPVQSRVAHNPFAVPAGSNNTFNPSRVQENPAQSCIAPNPFAVPGHSINTHNPFSPQEQPRQPAVSSGNFQRRPLSAVGMFSPQSAAPRQAQFGLDVPPMPSLPAQVSEQPYRWGQTSNSAAQQTYRWGQKSSFTTQQQQTQQQQTQQQQHDQQHPQQVRQQQQDQPQTPSQNPFHMALEAQSQPTWMTTAPTAGSSPAQAPLPQTVENPPRAVLNTAGPQVGFTTPSQQVQAPATQTPSSNLPIDIDLMDPNFIESSPELDALTDELRELIERDEVFGQGQNSQLNDGAQDRGNVPQQEGAQPEGFDALLAFNEGRLAVEELPGDVSSRAFATVLARALRHLQGRPASNPPDDHAWSQFFTEQNHLWVMLNEQQRDYFRLWTNRSLYDIIPEIPRSQEWNTSIEMFQEVVGAAFRHLSTPFVAPRPWVHHGIARRWYGHHFHMVQYLDRSRGWTPHGPSDQASLWELLYLGSVDEQSEANTRAQGDGNTGHGEPGNGYHHQTSFNPYLAASQHETGETSTPTETQSPETSPAQRPDPHRMQVGGLQTPGTRPPTGSSRLREEYIASSSSSSGNSSSKAPRVARSTSDDPRPALELREEDDPSIVYRDPEETANQHDDVEFILEPAAPRRRLSHRDWTEAYDGRYADMLVGENFEPGTSSLAEDRQVVISLRNEGVWPPEGWIVDRFGIHDEDFLFSPGMQNTIDGRALQEEWQERFSGEQTGARGSPSTPNPTSFVGGETTPGPEGGWDTPESRRRRRELEEQRRQKDEDEAAEKFEAAEAATQRAMARRQIKPLPSRSSRSRQSSTTTETYPASPVGNTPGALSQPERVLDSDEPSTPTAPSTHAPAEFVLSSPSSRHMSSGVRAGMQARRREQARRALNPLQTIPESVPAPTTTMEQQRGLPGTDAPERHEPGTPDEQRARMNEAARRMGGMTRAELEAYSQQDDDNDELDIWSANAGDEPPRNPRAPRPSDSGWGRPPPSPHFPPPRAIPGTQTPASSTTQTQQQSEADFSMGEAPMTEGEIRQERVERFRKNGLFRPLQRQSSRPAGSSPKSPSVQSPAGSRTPTGGPPRMSIQEANRLQKEQAEMRTADDTAKALEREERRKAKEEKDRKRMEAIKKANKKMDEEDEDSVEE